MTPRSAALLSVGFGIVIILGGIVSLLVFPADAEAQGRSNAANSLLYFIGGGGFVAYGVYRLSKQSKN